MAEVSSAMPIWKLGSIAFKRIIQIVKNFCLGALEKSVVEMIASGFALVVAALSVTQVPYSGRHLLKRRLQHFHSWSAALIE